MPRIHPQTVLVILTLAACSGQADPPERPPPRQMDPLELAFYEEDVPALLEAAEAEPKDRCWSGLPENRLDLCEATGSLVALCRYKNNDDACAAIKKIQPASVGDIDWRR